MSIDYSHMKNGFFMTEKFDFENLSAFNSAEGRIFDPLAVESGDFPQLRRVFFACLDSRSTSRESKLSNGVFRSSFGAWEGIEKFPTSLSIILSICNSKL